MVLERFRLFGRGKSREQLRDDGESQILKSDIDAIRIARNLLIMRELGKANEDEVKEYWKGLSKPEKIKYYEKIRDYLLELPTHLDENDEIAADIQRRLTEKGRTVEHAIEGAEYFSSVGRGRGKVKEVKMEKFMKKSTAGSGRGGRPPRRAGGGGPGGGPGGQPGNAPQPGFLGYCPLCQPRGRGNLILTRSGLGDKVKCDHCQLEFVWDGNRNQWVPINPIKHKKAKEAFDEEDLQKESERLREKENWWRRKGLDFAGNLRRDTAQVGGSGFLVLLGLVFGALVSWHFTVALSIWAGKNVLPRPKFTMPKNRMGVLWAHEAGEYDNRWSSGLSFTHSLLKLMILFFMGWGFLDTTLPFRGLLLLGFFFVAYFSLPGEYSPEEPEKFMEGILRPVVALILASVVFAGVFQSWELGWMCLAFFAVFPVATEKKNLARALGSSMSGVAASYENIDKLIFLVLILVAGANIMGWVDWMSGGLDLDLGTIAGNVFFPFWIISAVGGFMSPANVRPYTGIVMLIMVFLLFSTGSGEQIVGQGFFGAWWPSVHNALTSALEPMGEVFGTLSGTFGQTFGLLLNPVGYAQNIMEGTYEENPTGLTGSYGLELENLAVPPIYPGTQSMATFNVKNVGPAKAKDIRIEVELPDYLEGAVTVGSGSLDSSGNLESKMFYDSTDWDELSEMDPSYVIPLFFMIDASDCEAINKLESGVSRLTKRNQYIRVNFSVEYDYEVNSWMPLEVISNQEWQDRTAAGTFVQTKVGSHISTSPTKLSIDSFDQPIIAGNRQFYIGFNMTSAEGPDSRILWGDQLTKITLELPTELVKDRGLTCVPAPSQPSREQTGVTMLTWNGDAVANRAVFCYTRSIGEIDAPTKSYYIRATSTYRFRKWVSKDTLFAFGDACPEYADTGVNATNATTTSNCTGLGEEDCKGRTGECRWDVLPGASEPSCNPIASV